MRKGGNFVKISIEMRSIFKDADSPLKATATVNFDDRFVVKNVKLIETEEKGMFISMPSFRGRDGIWRSISHPITSECREEIQAALIEAYNKGLEADDSE